MTPRLVVAIALLTIREIARRRVLLVLFGLSVISVLLVGWGTDRLVGLSREEGVGELQIRVGVSQVLILIAFMFSFILAMSAAFLGAPAIASDVESGTALAMLARPLRRAELLVGRWLGLAVVVVAYAALSGLLAIAVVAFTTGHTPPAPFVAVGFLGFEAVIVLTLALSLGTRLPSMAAGAITVVVFALAWFAGVLGGIASALDARPLTAATEALRVIMPTDALWRGVVYGLEPPIVDMILAGRFGNALDANPFYATAPPPMPVVLWAIAWIVMVLGAGIWLFRRREL
jgi:ABC-type transport system involved in multi-copper enzyme maturation permease subunit